MSDTNDETNKTTIEIQTENGEPETIPVQINPSRDSPRDSSGIKHRARSKALTLKKKFITALHVSKQNADTTVKVGKEEADNLIRLASGKQEDTKLFINNRIRLARQEIINEARRAIITLEVDNELLTIQSDKPTLEENHGALKKARGFLGFNNEKELHNKDIDEFQSLGLSLPLEMYRRGDKRLAAAFVALHLAITHEEEIKKVLSDASGEIQSDVVIHSALISADDAPMNAELIDVSRIKDIDDPRRSVERAVEKARRGRIGDRFRTRTLGFSNDALTSLMDLPAVDGSYFFEVENGIVEILVAEKN